MDIEFLSKFFAIIMNVITNFHIAQSCQGIYRYFIKISNLILFEKQFKNKAK